MQCKFSVHYAHTHTHTHTHTYTCRSDSDKITAREASTTTPTDQVTPYSKASQEFLENYTSTMSASKSLYTLTHESYRRLDSPSLNPPPSTDVQSQSMFDLRGHSYHDDIQSIRKDISRYSRPSKEMEDIPKSSSRWSQFMCQEEESGDEVEGGQSQHLLTGTSNVAHFSMSRTN